MHVVEALLPVVAGDLEERVVRPVK